MSDSECLPWKIHVAIRFDQRSPPGKPGRAGLEHFA